MRLFTIPNLMTCGNLLCGCLGIVFSFRGDLLLAGGLIFVAAVLDFLDGFVARLLNQSSPIGKELDSLADMVTFGLLPSMIIFQLLERTTTTIDVGNLLISFSAFILTVSRRCDWRSSTLILVNQTHLLAYPLPPTPFWWLLCLLFSVSIPSMNHLLLINPFW
jgi:phosphatidylglycerophosphate synthase